MVNGGLISRTLGWIMGVNPESQPRGGRHFEDFEPGAVFQRQLTETVAQMENIVCSNMTLNPPTLNIDARLCSA